MQTISDLLRMPLHRYFGYQILDLKTEPEKLEMVASSLRVNLIYSILVNACPNISCYKEANYNNIKSPGCIILNQNRDESVRIINLINYKNKSIFLLLTNDS
jgi:hypothetical protein